MKLIKIAASVLKRIRDKKITRRSRVIRARKPASRGRNYYTNAQQLVDSYHWRFPASPPPKRTGEKRAAKRLKLHRKQWENTPDTSRVTRQQRRAQERRILKGGVA